MRDIDTLRFVAQMASDRRDERHFRIGALGVRKDGAVVFSQNGPALNKCPRIHAEVRLSGKLDVGSKVWVARQTSDGELAMAKPCKNCERTLRTRGVRRVIYSIGPSEYGILDLN